MPNTFTLIAGSTAGSGGVANFDFTSIPQTYTDLCLKVSGRSNRAQYQDAVLVYLNNSSTSFSWKGLIGDGAAASTYSATNNYPAEVPSSSMTANTFGSFEIYIPNYAGSTNKSFFVDSVDEGNQTTVYSYLINNLWSNTSAITSLKIAPQIGTAFVQYTGAYLYGIKNS